MNKTYNYTVRRHLGKGKHFGWWQIRRWISHSKQGEIVEYINPEENDVIFHICHLYNRPNTAKKILAGAHKAPCAWLCCHGYELFQDMHDAFPVEIGYNPRKNAHWGEVEDKLILGNLDGQKYFAIYSQGKKLYS